MPLWADQALLRTVDALFALRRYPLPPAERIAAGRVVSHRGEHDNRNVFENTVEAFERLRGTGIFGIEFDVRWTSDLVPVVFHDAHLLRLFADPVAVGRLTWAELHSRRPEIPDLHGFVRRFADDFHLMVEIKHETYPDPAVQGQRLAEALAPALERSRAHVLSLSPEMFAWLPQIPPARTMGVSRLNTEAISREALGAGRAGFSGHYASITRRHIERHRLARQVVGCGFPEAPGVLYRELARGIDFVFTNRAREVERWRREALAAATASGIPARRR